MPEERAQQVLAVLHGVSSAACAMREAVKIDGGVVGERIGLQPGPEVLDGVQFRSVRRQVFQVSRAGQNALVDELALVGLEAIPDKHDGRAQLALQVLEEVYRALRIDVGIGVKAEVQRKPVAAGRDADCGDRGDFLVAAATLTQERCLPAQAPGPAHQRGHQHAGFVDKDDRGSQSRGVFFTRGQSCSIQALIRSSLRSSARRVGFWGEKPKPCSNRLTWAG